MTIEFRKKYEIVKTVIDTFKDSSFTIGELYVICDDISRKHGIILKPNDVISTVMGLYDDFELDREIDANGTMHFKNSLQDITSSRK